MRDRTVVLMADGRRRRWVAHDVYFLDRPLGIAIFDQFGAAGVAVWFAFISACKKNHVEGRITYSSEPECLSILGLPGMPLEGPGGTFTLSEFFTLTGHHKVTRRRRRARASQVVCTRWEDWQNPRNTRPPDTQNRRSDGEDTTKKGTGYTEKEPADTDTDTDVKNPPVVPPLESVPKTWSTAWTKIERYVKRYGQHDRSKPPPPEWMTNVLRPLGGISAVRRDEVNKWDIRDAWKEAS